MCCRVPVSTDRSTVGNCREHVVGSVDCKASGGSFPLNLNLNLAVGMADRLHLKVDAYAPEVWLPSPPSASASVAAAGAVCYEPGCVLSMPDHQLRETAAASGSTTSSSFWLSRSEYCVDDPAAALFKGGGSHRHFTDHFYDQRLPTSGGGVVSLHRPLSSDPSVHQSLPAGGVCCDVSGQHAYADRFSSATNSCSDYVDLQPFQYGPPPPSSYHPWLTGDVGMPQQVPPPFGLSGCPPPGGAPYGAPPPPVELRYSPSGPWLNVKSERRSSSSATSSSVDGGAGAAYAAAQIVAASPTSFFENRSLKAEMSVAVTAGAAVECSSSCDDVVKKDDWICSALGVGLGGAGGQSDASQSSSVEQLSDAVRLHPICLYCHKKAIT